MAETFLSPVVEGALSSVVPLITAEITRAWNLKDGLKELQESLIMIRALLQDAEEQQIEKEPVRLWLKKLKDVAYDAEDVFDELGYENLRREVEMQVSSFNPFPKVTRYTKKITLLPKLANKVKNINESLAKIKSEAVIIHGLNQVSPRDHAVPHIDLDRMTDSVLDNPVVGRDQDVSKIVNFLSCNCNQQIFTVVPIVGMGGLGKTALAKLVCQEVMSRMIFDHNMWICVSDHFSDQNIFKEMLQSLNGNMAGMDNKDAILKQLSKELEGKKFLLVLDDVWDGALKGWKDFKTRLLTICKKNGNAIIATTRSEKVASAVKPTTEYMHNLNVLSDEGCWSIIERQVRANEGAPIPSELVTIGKEIAKKCGGVPLAAKALGGMLSSEREKEAWLSIKNSEVLNAVDGKENVKAILKLSFDHLPSYLKPCFVYCSTFPKDFLFEREELIQLWMAEGFLEPPNVDMGIVKKKQVDVGDGYFNALIYNSFFQDVERDKLGNIMGCKMHDLVHDLAVSLSKSEILTSESYSKGNSQGVVDLSCIRRVNVDSEDVKKVVAALKDDATKLRTVFLLEKDVVFDKLWKLKNLRSLKLKGSGIVELPSSIGEWKQLRYLDVSETKLKALPKSITKLYSLQTLRFLKCWLLGELPREEMKNLVSLKHIEFSMHKQMPSGLGRLTSLERLPLFVVGGDRGRSIEELECLNELRGKLRIKKLEKVRDKEEAQKAKLQEKKRITALKFVWSRNRGGSCSNNEEVLEGLHPHSNIKKIKIQKYMAKNFPAWVMKMKVPDSGSNSFKLLDSLLKLQLRKCKFCEQIPSLGILPNLRYLEIDGMREVKCIGNEFYGIDGSSSGGSGWKLFPKLKTLCLRKMENLIKWMAPEVGEGERVEELFPCLEEVTVEDCSALTNFGITNSSSLVKLAIERCDKLGNLFDKLRNSSFTSLKSLRITKCSSLTSIGALQSFTSLENLDISGCEWLESIPEELGELTCLTQLLILHCERLSYFPKEILGGLTRLESLGVGNFSEELDDFSYLNSSILQNPNSSLRHLYIVGNDRIKSLPDQVQNLTSLKFLNIWNFYQMEALPDWLGNISSLQSLCIYWCKNLKHLPTAAAMKCLSKLTDLRIYGCSYDLKESLTKRSGFEWDKVSHIPHVDYL